MRIIYKGTMSALLGCGCGLCCVSVVMDGDQLLLLLRQGRETLFPSRSVETENPVTFIFLPLEWFVFGLCSVSSYLKKHSYEVGACWIGYALPNLRWWSCSPIPYSKGFYILLRHFKVITLPAFTLCLTKGMSTESLFSIVASKCYGIRRLV